VTAQSEPADEASSLRTFCTRYLGRAWTPADGRPLSAVAETEQRLGVPLPPGLAAFHRDLGACEELLDAHNSILRLEELVVEDGRLFIAEEEQNVVSWAVPLPLPGAGGDAESVVWQRVNDGAASSWYSEEQGIVEFLRTMLDWTFEIGEVDEDAAEGAGEPQDEGDAPGGDGP
jgi:hypothetical protein